MMTLPLILTSQLLAARPFPKTGPRFGAGPRPGRFGNSIRAPFEFYPTPPEATRALLSAESFEGPLWEPACGNGAIAKELLAAGYAVTATDIVDWGYGEPGCDFLNAERARGRDIITNPPYGYGLADAFVRQALRFTAETGGRVAMLMNIASLCHPARHESFIRKPPSIVYALDDCICWPCGQPNLATRRTSDHRYAWLIWDQQNRGPTTLRWLSTAPFKDGADQSNAHQQQKGGNS